MSKVTEYSMYIMVIILIGIEWGVFLSLYSAVELFNKIKKIMK